MVFEEKNYKIEQLPFDAGDIVELKWVLTGVSNSIAHRHNDKWNLFSFDGRALEFPPNLTTEELLSYLQDALNGNGLENIKVYSSKKFKLKLIESEDFLNESKQSN